MSFLKNIWYVAGRAAEVCGDKADAPSIRARRILAKLIRQEQSLREPA